MRPMSWVSGIHDRLTSSCGEARRLGRAAQLARMLPCVSTTPFGSLVEPEENWMKATSSGRGLLHACRRARCHRGHRPGRCASAGPANSSRLAHLRRQRRRCDRASGARCRGRACPALRAMRSSLWRCSSLMPSATGTGTMPPRIARPEGVDELLVVAEEQDQLVAAPRAEALQVIEDAERALVQLGEGDVARVVLALEVGDAARRRCGWPRSAR